MSDILSVLIYLVGGFALGYFYAYRRAEAVVLEAIQRARAEMVRNLATHIEAIIAAEAEKMKAEQSKDAA